MLEDIRKYPLNLSDIKMMTCGHLSQFNIIIAAMKLKDAYSLEGKL